MAGVNWREQAARIEPNARANLRGENTSIDTLFKKDLESRLFVHVAVVQRARNTADSELEHWSGTEIDERLQVYSRRGDADAGGNDDHGRHVPNAELSRHFFLEAVDEPGGVEGQRLAVVVHDAGDEDGVVERRRARPLRNVPNLRNDVRGEGDGGGGDRAQGTF